MKLSLIVPKERGSWSLALEPIALGILVAPSAPGAALAIACVAGFFARRPLKLALVGSQQTHPSNPVATPAPDADPLRFQAALWAAALGVLALAVLAAANAMGRAHALWPLLLATPFGLGFLWCDLRHSQRDTEAELAGSMTFALLPAAFATLAGWPAWPALALAVVAMARSVPTVLTIRTYLRRHRGQAARVWLPITAAGVALVTLIELRNRSLVPWVAPAFAAVLLARTAFLAIPGRKPASARSLGTVEAIVGAAYVLAVVIAYRW